MNRHDRRAQAKISRQDVRKKAETIPMKEITKEEFDAHGIDRAGTPGFVEKRWYANKNLLGVVLFDHDNEWAWVVLAKHLGRGYAAIDFTTSYKTCDDAVAGMVDGFQRHDGIDMSTLRDPPITMEHAVSILARTSGMTEDQVRAGVEDFKKNPRPGNN